MKHEVIESKYEFTEEEKNVMARNVTELELKVAQLEEEKKNVDDEFKAKIDPLYDQIHYLSRCVQNGYEPRNFECRIERDSVRKMRVYRDVKSERIIREVPFTPEDYQEEFPGMADNPPAGA